MEIPVYDQQATGAEMPPIGIAHLIAAGKGTDHKGTLVLFRRLASFRRPDRPGGGIEG